MKYCPNCQRDRPLDEYYVEKGRRGGGLSSTCKECARERKRRYFRERYYPDHKTEIIAGVLRRRKEAKEP